MKFKKLIYSMLLTSLFLSNSFNFNNNLNRNDYNGKSDNVKETSTITHYYRARDYYFYSYISGEYSKYGNIIFQCEFSYSNHYPYLGYYLSFQYNFSNTIGDMTQGTVFFLKKLDDAYVREIKDEKTYNDSSINPHLFEVSIPAQNLIEQSKNGKYLNIFSCRNAYVDGYSYTNGIKNISAKYEQYEYVDTYTISLEKYYSLVITKTKVIEY